MISLMASGMISNIQRYSTQDGPGIRTTVFLTGCPLSCWWCHNPEARSSRPKVVIQESRCVRCGECANVCPTDGSTTSENAPHEPGPDCALCGACIEACPTGARQMTARRRTVEEVVAEIKKDSIFYDESGGGVTFSGGEPLMQPQYLIALLEACRACGIRTAVDTCGHAPRESLLAAASVTDLFLYDLKFMDDAKHIEYTGVSNARIVANLAELGRTHGNIWLRIPVIPGLNDSDDQLGALARYAASIAGVRQVNLLPYHRTGVYKFRRLGEQYRLGHILPPTPERMESALAAFSALGLTVKSGG